MERYMQAYGEIINPLPDLDNLPSVTELGVLNPPQRKRLKGRPHKNRRRAVDEAPADDFRKKTGTVRCERCKEMGHNRRTCQNAPVNEKGCSSRQRVAGKGSQNTSTLAVSSQMHTRSQTSTTPSSQISKQTKLRAQKAAKLERQKKRMREGLGQ
ncbi:hypothetical protein NE237_003971 [Protea cynaroides]|uniref:CCHC-type domain-containing protein n=1 Tax=Protea cynaroides TaxID=273540 RepID=A0A9Q0QT54_9MAGN|nr:hypothetical protein NE237_003971 [Protea cynaroides]